MSATHQVITGWKARNGQDRWAGARFSSRKQVPCKFIQDIGASKCDVIVQCPVYGTLGPAKLLGIYLVI